MKIYRYEQSGFIFESNSGQRLALDIAGLTPLESLNSVNKVDGFLVSHIHFDHFSEDHIKKLSPTKAFLNVECRDAVGEISEDFSVEAIAPGSVVEFGDFKINSYEADHGPNTGGPVLENQSFIIEVDGKKVFFAGDMYFPSGLDAAQIEVDLTLLPVGTHYTFGPKEAFDYVQKFSRTGIVVPMHYEMKPETSEQFSDLVGSKLEVKILNTGDTLTI